MSDANDDAGGRRGIVRGLWRALRRPSGASLGGLLITGMVLGVVFWGGFNWALELTNTEQFCISCHEMERNVFRELRTTVHYTNRTGVRATCPDCHVPREWVYKIARKIKASNELWHHMLGTIDTPEKFEAKRLTLAQHEWDRMKANDSRECRNCHDFGSMDFTKQENRSSARHEVAIREGQTCIDCHKGIAHELPAGTYEEQKLSSAR
ncbi:MAG: NapC/NirT family cytochrome c [Ectothiorhodospiraceae bacterium]|nr:NapC/NirT family cytochrome c [Ectothiorhodospiraceae bacterium]